MNLTNGKIVLDVGCGTGWCVWNLLEQFPFINAFGLDLSHGMLVKARAELGALKPNKFIFGDSEVLPFFSQTFDYVVCTSSFHHYQSPQTALGEFKRVLRPGGKVIIVEHCRRASIGVWLWDRWLRIFEAGHVKYYTKEELIALFKEVEFDQINVPYAKAGLMVHGKLFDSTVVITGKP